MAGFIFAIGDEGLEGIRKCVETGTYATMVNGTASNKNPFEGTLADYCSINAGDNIYFFYKRKIYGVGKVVNVGKDGKYKNYLNATKLVNHYSFDESIKAELLVGNDRNSLTSHWLCLFEPSPAFYKTGIDMDDLLAYKPQNIRRLRTFWKTSFIKVDDLENDTIKEFIYLRNNESKNLFIFDKTTHNRISSKINDNYIINPLELLPECLDNSKKYIKHEMALEAIFVNALNKGFFAELGKWDFVTHQVCASPFKPVDYMDRIDVFGYKYKVIEDSKIITKYIIVELKAEKADLETVAQVSKYVDYICKEYAYGNYELIEAYIVANNLDGVDISIAKSMSERTYNIGSHPVIPKKWNGLSLIKYELDNSKLKLKRIDLK